MYNIHYRKCQREGFVGDLLRHILYIPVYQRSTQKTTWRISLAIYMCMYVYVDDTMKDFAADFQTAVVWTLRLPG